MTRNGYLVSWRKESIAERAEKNASTVRAITVTVFGNRSTSTEGRVAQESARSRHTHDFRILLGPGLGRSTAWQSIVGLCGTLTRDEKFNGSCAGIRRNFVKDKTVSSDAEYIHIR